MDGRPGAVCLIRLDWEILGWIRLTIEKDSGLSLCRVQKEGLGLFVRLKCVETKSN